jgi:hypothetical protein
MAVQDHCPQSDRCHNVCGKSDRGNLWGFDDSARPLAVERSPIARNAIAVIIMYRKSDRGNLWRFDDSRSPSPIERSLS